MGIKMYVTQSTQGENGSLRSVMFIAFALGMRRTTVGRSKQSFSCYYCSKKRHGEASFRTKQENKNDKIGQQFLVNVLQEKDDSDKKEPKLVVTVWRERNRETLIRQKIFKMMSLTKTQCVSKTYLIVECIIEKKLADKPAEEERRPL